MQPVDRPSNLENAIQNMARALHPAIRAGCRRIDDGDAAHLTHRERQALINAVPPVQRASGAARLIARQLLAADRNGRIPDLVPHRPNGPDWPSGWVGSLTHDANFAAAAVAPASSLQGIGIDIEPAEPLPAAILSMVATPREQGMIEGDLHLARLLFVVKEAVYKTTHPLDRVFLEHHDVEVDFATEFATTRSGFRVPFRCHSGTRLCAVAALVADG